MTFIEAVKEMEKGKRARRASWLCPTDMLRIRGGFICWCCDEFSAALSHVENVLATDWEVVE